MVLTFETKILFFIVFFPAETQKKSIKLETLENMMKKQSFLKKKRFHPLRYLQKNWRAQNFPVVGVCRVLNQFKLDMVLNKAGLYRSPWIQIELNKLWMHFVEGFTYNGITEAIVNLQLHLTCFWRRDRRIHSDQISWSESVWKRSSCKVIDCTSIYIFHYFKY